MKVKRISEETLTRIVLFLIMVAVVSATYYVGYYSEYIFHNDNPIFNGLTYVMFLISTFFVVLWCMSLL